MSEVANMALTYEDFVDFFKLKDKGSTSDFTMSEIVNMGFNIEDFVDFSQIEDEASSIQPLVVLKTPSPIQPASFFHSSQNLVKQVVHSQFPDVHTERTLLANDYTQLPKAVNEESRPKFQLTDLHTEQLSVSEGVDVPNVAKEQSRSILQLLDFHTERSLPVYEQKVDIMEQNLQRQREKGKMRASVQETPIISSNLVQILPEVSNRLPTGSNPQSSKKRVRSENPTNSNVQSSRKRVRPEGFEDNLVRFNEIQDPSQKPPYSYASLIAQAILNVSNKMLTLNEIYSWISSTYPFYTREIKSGTGWMAFVKLPRPDDHPGKGCLWTIAEEQQAVMEVSCLKERRAAKKSRGILESDSLVLNKSTIESSIPVPAASTQFSLCMPVPNPTIVTPSIPATIVNTTPSLPVPVIKAPSSPFSPSTSPLMPPITLNQPSQLNYVSPQEVLLAPLVPACELTAKQVRFTILPTKIKGCHQPLQQIPEEHFPRPQHTFFYTLLAPEFADLPGCCELSSIPSLLLNGSTGIDRFEFDFNYHICNNIPSEQPSI
ncbi:hypothetical protein G9A89_011641 [Geosiphon pyriformis]|nr:hypothetical protein G9A89_011641 [Geosiphon pyriformis]